MAVSRGVLRVLLGVQLVREQTRDDLQRRELSLELGGLLGVAQGFHGVVCAGPAGREWGLPRIRGRR